jgi:hypothetical protein
MKGFKKRRLGDQRLAGSRRGADQHALFRGKPRQQPVFLNLIGREGKRIEILLGESAAFFGGKGCMQWSLTKSDDLLWDRRKDVGQLKCKPWQQWSAVERLVFLIPLSAALRKTSFDLASIRMNDPRLLRSRLQEFLDS